MSPIEERGALFFFHPHVRIRLIHTKNWSIGKKGREMRNLLRKQAVVVVI